MIKIKRTTGTQTSIIEVTHGAYENIFRPQGYVPVDKTADGAGETTEKSEDDLFCEKVEAKPISQWSKKELQRYATLKGLDATANDLRETIKKVIENGSD
jgi:hypothetical protein